MPPGSVRALLALMVVGLVCALMLIHSDPPPPIPAYLIYLMFLILGHYFAARGGSPGGGDTDAWHRQPLYLPMLPVVILGGFFAGALVRMVIGRQPPAWYQDLEAWLSLISVLLMSVATLIHLVINPSLQTPIMSLPVWECILSAVVAFYFGARS
jgi:hypothetical protein